MPSARPSSLPIRFCPPSPRVSERYAVSTCLPRASQVMSCVSSSSGCAPITSTRAVTSRPATASPNAVAPRSCAEQETRRGQTRQQRRDGGRTKSRRRYHRDLGVRLLRAVARRRERRAPPARSALLLLVRRRVTLGRARALRAADVAHGQHVPRRTRAAAAHVRPRAHVLRLFLRPHHFLEVRVAIDDRRDLLARPRIQLVHSHERHIRRSLLRAARGRSTSCRCRTRDAAPRRAAPPRPRSSITGWNAPLARSSSRDAACGQAQQALGLHQDQRPALSRIAWRRRM